MSLEERMTSEAHDIPSWFPKCAIKWYNKGTPVELKKGVIGKEYFKLWIFFYFCFKILMASYLIYLM